MTAGEGKRVVVTAVQPLSETADCGQTTSPAPRESPPRTPPVTFQPPDANTELELLRRELDVLRRREREHRLRLQQLESERRAGGTLQRELLPKELPEITGAEVATLYYPAEFISGDLYDVVRLDEEHVALTVIDATGHGIAAALLAGHARRVLRGVIREGPWARLHPDEVLARLNEEVRGHELTDCVFIAAVYAVYHEPSSTIRWARGGLPYPVLHRPGSKPRQVISEGPIVGACEDARFAVVEMKLQAGEAVVFHTDGWDDAEELGALRGFLSASLVSRSPGGLCDEFVRMEREVADAARVKPLGDDVTLLAIRALAPTSAALGSQPQVALAAS